MLTFQEKVKNKLTACFLFFSTATQLYERLVTELQLPRGDHAQKFAQRRF